METISPKKTDNGGDGGAMAPKTMTTPTSANGKKLVQARLPFKTLGGGALTVEPARAATAAVIVVTTERRKRKLSKTGIADDAERAPKLNRIEVANDLLSTEVLDESVDYSMSDRKSIGKSEVKSMKMKSESKENVDGNERKLDNNGDDDKDDDDDDVLEIDDSSEGGSSDDIDLTEPKAKKCLDMNPDAKRAKRTNDDHLITIKLPMAKKTKETSKKSKKADKPKIDKRPVIEISLSDDTDDDKRVESAQKETDTPSANAADANAADESMSPIRTADDQMARTPGGDKGMTPKQIARRAESEKKLLEKQRAKEERERERQRERDERELQKKKEREAKEEQRKAEKVAKEQKRLAELEEKEKKKQAEAEEKEKKRQAEAEEKEKKKQAEIEAKNEERRKREEQKEEERKRREEQKEEERKRREEERRQREEADQVEIRKTAAKFASFFVPKKVDANVTVSKAADSNVSAQSQQFMSFQIKGDMKVAAVTRRQLSAQQRAELETVMFTNVEKDDLYLGELKAAKRVPQQSGKTWSPTDEEAQAETDDDLFFLDADGVVQVIDDKQKKQNYHAKYFRFHENRRPPFYGTWRKKSSTVGPRRPFAQDKQCFDYEVDSDDEWEEEEPGESLHGSDDEKDQESDDDYVIDNKFFVPHGHLSDEELNDEDEMDEEDDVETQKAKLKSKQEAFDNEIHKKTEKLKPRVIGLIWQQPDRSQPANCTKATWDLLRANSFMMIGDSVTLTPPNSNDENSDEDDADPTKASVTRKLKITEREVPNLIRLINGNQNNIKFLTKEFCAFIAKTQTLAPNREYSNSSIQTKIRELAEYRMCPEPGPMHNRMCWYVPIEKRKSYELDDMTLPYAWQYTLTPRRGPVDASNGKVPANGNGLDPDKEKLPKEKLKEHTRRDSDPCFDDVIELEDSNSCGLSETVTSETVRQASEKPANYNIAKFIRKLSKEEKRKQFESLTLRAVPGEFEMSGSSQSQTPPATVGTKEAEKKPAVKPIAVKKRAKLLASGPIGQEISNKLKDTLVTQFVTHTPFNSIARKRKSPSDNNDGSQSPASTASTDDGLVPPKKTAKETTTSTGDIIVLD